MKTLFVALFAFLGGFASQAQSVVHPFPRTITVNGSAEMELMPDEVYVVVDLKEYEKKGVGKIKIDRIRQDFLQAVKSLNLPDSAVTVAGYDGNNGNPWYRRRNKLKDELYASISYQVKLRSSAQVDMLVDKLDDAATQNFYILRTSHSKLAEYRTQLKAQAVRAARQKAQYLAEAANAAIGVPITIHEPNEFYQPYYNMRAANMEMKAQAMDVAAAPDVAQADFKKIKLKYDVTVVFELK